MTKYEQIVKLIKNRLNGGVQSILISNAKSTWRPVTSCVPWVSILGNTTFNASINDLEDGAV